MGQAALDGGRSASGMVMTSEWDEWPRKTKKARKMTDEKETGLVTFRVSCGDQSILQVRRK